MGGIIARCALMLDSAIKVNRLVMLTPPNQGSFVARRLAPWLGSFCRPLPQLSDAPDSFVNRLGVPPGIEIGVIAAGSDRVVALPSTFLAEQRDHIVIPGDHGIMPLRRDAGEQVLAFLQTGSFRRTTPSADLL
jgi:hypothetical protein